MKHANRLTTRQQSFLYAVRDQPLVLDNLVERLKLKPWLLSKWLRRRVFREALAEVLREMRRRKDLEFELAARRATNVLSRLIAGEKGSHLERQASFDILDLYFTRPRPGRKVIKRVADSSKASLIHPDVSPEEALSHIEALEGKQDGDKQAL